MNTFIRTALNTATQYKVPAIIVLLCITVVSARAEEIMFIRDAKRLYNMIGNPNYDLADQGHAFGVLESRASGYDNADQDAVYYLAECYVTGKTGEGGPDFARNRKGFPPNRPEAYKLAVPLYERAADHNHLPSLVKLAGLYADGQYVPKDLDKSMTYLVRAVQLRDKAALTKLSELYSEGFRGVDNQARRFSLVELLANNGFPLAQLEVSQALISQNTKEAFDKAKHFLVPLAQNGNTNAAALLENIARKEDAQKAEYEASLRKDQMAKEEAEQHLREQQGAKQKELEEEALHHKQLVKQTTADAEVAKRTSAKADLFSYLGWFLFLTSLVLAIPGTILGFRRKIVIYDAKTDLYHTWIIIFSFILCGFGFANSQWVGWTLLSLGIICLLLSVLRSFRANQSVGKVILAMPTKFVLLVAIAICGVIAVGGALAAAQGVKDKKYKEAAGAAAVGAAGAGGFYFLNKFINTLITTDTAVQGNMPEPPIIADVSSNTSQTKTAVTTSTSNPSTPPSHNSEEQSRSGGGGVLAALGTVFAAALAAEAMEQHSAKCYCKYCGQSFTTLSNLTSNCCSRNPRGSGERHAPYCGIEKSPYHCQYCGQSFTTLANLTSNCCSRNPQGSGERHAPYEGRDQSPYHCQYCGQSFTTLSNLTSNCCSRNPRGSGARHAPM